MAQGDQAGIEPGEGRGGSNWKVSGFPTVLVPAYSLIKQEQLQLAQASFRKKCNSSCRGGHSLQTYCTIQQQNRPKHMLLLWGGALVLS